MDNATKAHEQHHAAPTPTHRHGKRSPGAKDSRARWGNEPLGRGGAFVFRDWRRCLDELEVLVERDRGDVPASTLRTLGAVLNRTKRSTRVCNDPTQWLAKLAGLHERSFFRGLRQLEELAMIAREHVNPADPRVPNCKRRVRWTATKGGKVVPSCPGCVWHHGGLIIHVLFDTPKTMHAGLRRSGRRYLVAARDPARRPTAPCLTRVIPSPASDLSLNPSPPPPGSMGGTLVSEKADAPSAPGVFVPRPAPTCNAPTEAVRCTEPPRAAARPSPAPAADGFAANDVAPDPRSFERERARSGPPSTLTPDGELVLEAHRRHVRPGLRDPSPLGSEIAAIALALSGAAYGAHGVAYGAAQLAEAMQGAAISDYNRADNGRDKLEWILAPRDAAGRPVDRIAPLIHRARAAAAIPPRPDSVRGGGRDEVPILSMTSLLARAHAIADTTGRDVEDVLTELLEGRHG